MIGTIVGLRWLSQTMTRYVIAVILGAAGSFKAQDVPRCAAK